VRKVTGMWYKVQVPGYFNLLPILGRQSPRGGEMNILKEKYCSALKHIFNYWAK